MSDCMRRICVQVVHSEGRGYIWQYYCDCAGNLIIYRMLNTTVSCIATMTQIIPHRGCPCVISLTKEKESGAIKSPITDLEMCFRLLSTLYRREEDVCSVVGTLVWEQLKRTHRDECGLKKGVREAPSVDGGQWRISIILSRQSKIT